MISYIHRVKHILKTVELSLLTLFLVTMIVLSFSQIVFRKVFLSSIPHADQIVTMLVMYIALIGAALATLEDKHITVEVLSKFVSDRINTMMAVVFNFFSVWIVYILYAASLEYIELQQDNIEFFLGSIKTITIEAFMVPGFILIGIGFLLNGTESCVRLFSEGGK